MPSGYYRFPTIHNDHVVFVSEDDLWSVSADGGIARRLTSNLGEVSRPSLSPDGSLLAFIGREEGKSEIYVMPALGGPARRLTYMGGSQCITAGWRGEDKVIFASNVGHWHNSFTQLHTVGLDNGSPEALGFGLARAISFGPAGGVVLGRNTDDPARWKRYRGGTTGHIWIDEQGDGNFRPLIDLRGNLASPMWLGERIYFLADHEGVGNLYSCLPSGTDLRRHTHHQDYYARNASSDGKRIVYHAGADLYLYDPQTDHGSPIKVEYHSSQTQRNRKFVSPARYLEDWSIHPKGHSLAITSRGKLFSFSNWEGAVIQHGEDPMPPEANGEITGVRYRLAKWLNDGKRIIAVTDKNGEESFVIMNAGGSGEPEYITGLDIGRPEALAANPLKNQIVFSNHRYELLFLDLEQRELRTIDRGKALPIGGFEWSPDGKWVAYSASISLHLMALKLWNAASGEVTQITQPILKDLAPSFDPQGRYLYFLSYRTFDPVSDQMQFDLNFPQAMKPYLITLQKDLTSPFIPLPRQEAVEEREDEVQEPDEDESGQAPESPAAIMASASEAEPEEDSSGEAPPASKGKEEEEKEKLLQIDLEGIQGRVIAFPVEEGIFGRIKGTQNGKVIYSRYPVEGILEESFIHEDQSAKGCLLVYNFELNKEENLIHGISDFDISADAATLIYRAEYRLRVLKAGEKPLDESSKPNRQTGWINLGRVKLAVVPGIEWRQMFREAWRLQRDQFWTEDMSQVDWLNVHDRYLALVDRVGSRSEFSDLMWEMQGELGTSHAYEFGGDYRPEPGYSQGFLGADFAYIAESGNWRVTHILKGDPWDAKSDSPLNAAGANISVGDELVAINGKKLTRSFSPGAALVNLAGSEVILTIAPADSQVEGSSPSGNSSKAVRYVTVKALGSEIAPRYREWVESNRRRVHEASNGRVGYIHIPDMAGPGYAEFHRGFLAEVDREGMIVDVRFNRGGNVSSLLLEKLARRRLGYDWSRWSQEPTPYPPESVFGPMVALTNEFAGSDGDIFSHGFKLLGLGPLIGKRTWGGVVGIWPRFTLVDGTVTTQPEFSFWFNDVGWAVENYGTEPDIEVDIQPQDYMRAVDTQLERAIQEILRLLEENPPKLPDFSKRPNLSIPKLPEG